MLTAGQLETESLKVIETGRCKSSNVSRAPYQKHQKHEKHQKLNATSLLLNTTAKREQPRTQRSESYSSMKNNAFRNLSVWFMVWYGSIRNINHKLLDSRFQQLTYDNLFLLNKPSRSGFWTREACLKWFPWVRMWSCWVKLFTHQQGWITFTTSHHFHKCFKDYLCLYTLCPNEILGLLIFSPSDPWCPGACEAFRIEQRVPDFVVSMSSTRSTGHKLAPGSPSKWPFWKRVPCFEISVLLRDCIKELTFWGGTKQEVQGGTEEKAKISTYWILIVLDFNAFIQRIISDLSTFAKRHAFGDDLMLLLGENPNLQNWSISKLSSELVTHQLRVLLHRSTRLQEGHIPTWHLLSYWDAHLWCASCKCKSLFSGKDDGCDYAKFSHLKWPQCWRVISTEWHTSKDVQSPERGCQFATFSCTLLYMARAQNGGSFDSLREKSSRLSSNFRERTTHLVQKKCCFACFHCLNSTSCRQIQLLLQWHVLCEPKSMMIACGYNV